MLNMAIFHLTVKTGSRLGGQSARAKADYIEREGKYERQDDELAHRESENMPEWAKDDPRSYWEAADECERANGRLFREVEFALPKELNEGDQVELAREFASKLTSAGGERLPYTLAVHRGKGENPHAHLMISERANDGIERDAAQWFKRYNSKEPEKGGARKSMATRPKDWLEQTRKDWADQGEPGAGAGRGAGRGLPERAWSSSTGTPWRLVTSARRRGWSIGSRVCTLARTTSPEPSAGWCWRGPRPRGRWRTAIRSLRATAQRSKRWRGCCGAPTLSLPRSPSSSPPMFGIASSVVAGATALITGGADNGKCTGPSKGRRGEVHGDG